MRWPRQVVSVIRSPEKLVSILREQLPAGVEAPALPPIDFRHREALLVAVGPRSSTGYALEVVRITERGGRIDVVLHERTPELGERVTVRLTYPYRLIALPASGERVHVRLEGRP